MIQGSSIRSALQRRGAGILAVLAGVTGLGASAQAQFSGPVIEHQVVVLQGLDKITARVFPIEAEIKQVIHFGTLEIIVQTCQETPPEEPPESAAYLDILDARPGEEPQYLFRGWMFASSPAVSALEHPVYDVWVVDCKKPLKK